MRVIDAEAVARALDPVSLADAIAEAFRADIAVPLRHHHTLGEGSGGPPAMALLMPAWTGKALKPFLGVKIVTVHPDNATRGLPSIHGSYFLSDGSTGVPLAVMDGTALTRLRTAAASALAARFLARPDASRMLMVGAGALAVPLIEAHAAVRPIREVLLWNRTRSGAEAVLRRLRLAGTTVRVVDDLETAARGADVISCATLSAAPLVRGAWLKDGAHLDLVGAYTPQMRESDDDAVTRASLFVDTRVGALKEGGDMADPLARGVISAADVKADLFELCRGVHPGRTRPDEITLFKSVGTAIEDLAAAMLVWSKLS